MTFFIFQYAYSDDGVEGRQLGNDTSSEEDDEDLMPLAVRIELSSYKYLYN